MRFKSKELKDKGVKDLYNYCKEYNCAMVSGDRGECSAEKNEERMGAVRNFVSSFGYDYIPTLGYWKGEDDNEFVRENSCFVIGSNKQYDSEFARNLKSIAKRYEQDSVLFSILTNSGPLAYYYHLKEVDNEKAWEKVGEITADNIDEIIERWLREKGKAGYSEIDRVKFVFDDVKKVNRHWGEKNRFHVSEVNTKLHFTSNILKGLMNDSGVYLFMGRLEKEHSKELFDFLERNI